MPLTPVTHQSWIFGPPLEPPLALRLANGRFDSLRPRELPPPPLCASTQIIPADDPRNPTGRDVPFENGLHQAVDLAAAAGSCVYAAYGGRVAKVEVQPGGATANVSIDHHPPGLGFVTCYNHVTALQVGPGDGVREGQPIAEVSAAADDPALHFEVWAVVHRAGPSQTARRATATWFRRPHAAPLRLGAAARGRRGAVGDARAGRRGRHAHRDGALLRRPVRRRPRAARPALRAHDGRRGARRRAAAPVAPAAPGAAAVVPALVVLGVDVATTAELV